LVSAGVPELAEPTLNRGETHSDLRTDRGSFEDFDVDAAAARGYGFGRLDQLAIEHLLGAR
jgi:xylose isomerase